MTPRTYAQHAAALDNLRQRRYAPETERARAARERWQQQRVELTPETGIQCEWGRAEKEQCHVTRTET